MVFLILFFYTETETPDESIKTTQHRVYTSPSGIKLSLTKVLTYMQVDRYRESSEVGGKQQIILQHMV